MEAFEVIVNRYKNRLMNFVFRFIGDYDVAEDIVQETFLRVFKKRRDYRAIANFSTWIFTIAGNLAKSELRRQKRWREICRGGFAWYSMESGGERKNNERRKIRAEEKRGTNNKISRQRRII